MTGKISKKELKGDFLLVDLLTRKINSRKKWIRTCEWRVGEPSDTCTAAYQILTYHQLRTDYPLGGACFLQIQ